MRRVPTRSDLILYVGESTIHTTYKRTCRWQFTHSRYSTPSLPGVPFPPRLSDMEGVPERESMDALHGEADPDCPGVRTSRGGGTSWSAGA